MSLTNRLLTYLLSLLAVVLVGFSVGIYFFVGHYLHQDVDERLSSALNILTGSLDIEADSVEWEPADRTLVFSQGLLGENVSWYIADVDGGLIDRSQSPESDQFFNQRVPGAADSTAEETLIASGGWYRKHRRIKAPQIAENQIRRPRTAEEIEKGEYPALVLTTGMPQAETRHARQTLLLALAGLSTGLWLVCFAIGRWICRRALRPVSRMAQAASEMGSRDLHQRLPPVPSGDELQAMNEAFNGLLDRLEVSFQQQRRFTGDVSHQLRTPLTIIQGHAEVALRRERSVAEYQEVLQTICQQVTRLNQLVESLLFLARSDSDAALPPLEPLDLGNWLTDFEQTWKTSTQHARVHFETPPSDSIVVAARPEMLTEIVKNLLDNSIKYSPSDSPVILGFTETAGQAGIFVEDHGPGIAPADRSRIFQPFFRAESARGSGADGIGLGLSIANRLAGAMQGSIDVESEPNRGSRFLVWLRRWQTNS